MSLAILRVGLGLISLGWRSRSRAPGATAATLTGWRDTFAAAGEASLATQRPMARRWKTERLKAKLGEMLLERELLEQKIAALEGGRPLARRRSRR